MFVTTLSRRLTKPFAVFCLMLALVAGVGATAHPVAAARVGGGVDSVSVGCRIIQDRGDALLALWVSTFNNNPQDPALDDILAQIRANGQAWKDSGCEGAFGPIVVARAGAPIRTPLTPDDVRRSLAHS